MALADVQQLGPFVEPWHELAAENGRFEANWRDDTLMDLEGLPSWIES
jgi:hypothetical protein